MRTDISQLGQLIYNAIDEYSLFEKDTWAIERIKRVVNRLNSASQSNQEFKVVIPYLGDFMAFTAPGNHIFISRQLFQMCRNDDMAAFIIAHEMAHHSLGHFSIFPKWLKKITNINFQLLLLAPYRMVESRIYGVKRECDADKYALLHCYKRGYDIKQCLAIFDIFENHALDHGNLDTVFGSEIEDENISNKNLFSKIKSWYHLSKRGYLPIKDRKKLLEDYYNSIRISPSA